MATAESLSITQTINGKRYYIIEENKYPSVTTVLGAMTDSSGLDAWRKRVGEEEADRISKFSANRGTIMHQMIEYFLGSEKDSQKERLKEAQTLIIDFSKEEGFTEEELDMGRRLFYSFYNNGFFDKISKVVSIEETLYSHQMGGYAGRVDNIYENAKAHLLILDFKTSRKRKKKDWIKNYFLQISAYFMAYWEMHGIKPHGGEIWIAVENDEPQIFEITWEDIQEYGKEFLGMVKEYHKLYPLPENI
jgi:genome maintenance exonuclease 1